MRTRRRRGFITAFAALAVAPLLGGCGFKLRGAYQVPFDTIYLGVSPNSSLGADLTRRITAGSNARVVEDRKDAQAILEIAPESRTRDVLSVNAQGQVQEFTLRQSISFRLHDGQGREFLGLTQLSTKLDVSYDASQTLAFESETELLYRNLQNDLVGQMLRRIAAVKGVKG